LHTGYRECENTKSLTLHRTHSVLREVYDSTLGFLIKFDGTKPTKKLWLFAIPVYLQLMKRIGFFILILLVFGCDRTGKYKYWVTNGTQDSLKVFAVTFDNDLVQVAIPPLSSSEIYVAGTGLLSAYAPDDFFKDTTMYDFKTLRLVIDHKEINNDFRLRRNWIYYTPDISTGIYQLVVIRHSAH